MTKSDVFFADMKVSDEENQQEKMKRLIRTAGFGDLDLKRKFVAIKIHFGELGNLAFLRPNFARTVVDLVKESGGKPFLTDCNTLYVGHRKNALDHIETAYLNGFTPYTTGCHVLIGDGLKGTDEEVVPVPNGELLKEARIGRAVMDADVVISLTHFKCHEATGIGGALKNIGMGCGSRAGKMAQHSSGKPEVAESLCIGCGKCRRVCAFDAPAIEGGKARIDYGLCVGCGRCIGVCPVDAMHPGEDSANDDLSKKIAEYSAAVLHGRPHFHVSLVQDVSPFCDCHNSSDVPIVPDVGMFASLDPVALDWASAESVNRQPVQRGSVLESAANGSEADYFTRLHPTTDWRVCLEHGERLGLGRCAYDLREV